MPSSETIRQTFIEFFAERGHTLIDGASLPADDRTALFTSAGMQPLIPYFSGAPHPAGRRLVDWQRCLRTSDIDEVGDEVHLTMFEMLGNWSLGDYGPHESLAWSLELLTDGFGLDPGRICVTVFAGDETSEFDQAAHDRWTSLGLGPDRIFRYGREHNWWGPPARHGPCGPDSEIFYWVSDGEPTSEPALDDRWLEIWNNVFITYELTPDGRYLPLAQQNVDTGIGLERISVLLQQVGSVYDTDLFTPIMDVARRLAGPEPAPVSSLRIVCDHLRAATFLIADGVRPGNVEHGYVLRRLIRRAIRHGRLAGIDGELARPVALAVIDRFGAIYPHLAAQRDRILDALQAEERTFARTLARAA